MSTATPQPTSDRRAVLQTWSRGRVLRWRLRIQDSSLEVPEEAAGRSRPTVYPQSVGQWVMKALERRRPTRRTRPSLDHESCGIASKD